MNLPFAKRGALFRGRALAALSPAGFDAPDVSKPEAFTVFREGEGLRVQPPARPVAMLEIAAV